MSLIEYICAKLGHIKRQGKWEAGNGGMVYRCACRRVVLNRWTTNVWHLDLFREWPAP